MRVPLKLEANRSAGYTRVENMARVQVDVEGGVRKHTERFRLDKTNDWQPGAIRPKRADERINNTDYIFDIAPFWYFRWFLKYKNSQSRNCDGNCMECHFYTIIMQDKMSKNTPNLI